MILPKRSLQFLLPAVLLLTACGSDDDPQPQPQPQPGTDVVAAPMVLQDIKVNTVLEDRNTDPAKPDYLVNSNIRVMAELTVKPGVVIAFEQDTRLDLNTDGKIIAVGTADKKIRFIGKTAQKGFWAGITIYSNSSANQFAYAEFLHAGSKAMLDATKTTIALFETARVSVTNCTISESGGYGIY
ncbi:MAG TPA: hypothetical protein VK927_02685, partial [Adhaeribacter sp.]|nr:hypothetical protein [Adhaeribacter sp.]